MSPGFLRHPARAGDAPPSIGGVEAAAAHPLPDAPRGPLFALSGVPIFQPRQRRRLRCGLQPWDSLGASIHPGFRPDPGRGFG